MRALIISILFFFFFLVETTININIGFIKPNFTLIILILYSLLRGHKEGTLVGFLLGFIIDGFYGSVFGVNTIIYMHVGYVLGCLKKEFARESYGFITLMIVGVFMFSFERYLICYFVDNHINMGTYLSNYTFVEVVLNTFISIGLYPLIYMINENIEEKEYKKI